MDQAIKKAFAPTDNVLFLHTGNPFSLLSNFHLFSFPESSPALDPSVLNLDMMGGGEEEEEESINEEEKEEKRKAKSFEMDMEDDEDRSFVKLLIRK